MSAVSGNSTLTVPADDFTQLSDTEQRAVAERLLKIAESNWRPFWCTDKSCTTGDPHALRGGFGEVTYVDDAALAGPNGEPVAAYFHDTKTGAYHTALDPERVWPHEVRVGTVVLDPNWAHNHARADQRLPGWKKPWKLFIMSGRGTGKTRTGVEFVTLCARKGQNGAIVGRRGTELVNTHVKTILEHSHPEFMPVHWASKDILEWPNGAITYLFSAEKPENIRSVNLSYVWIDEAAFMDEIATAWMNLKMATRIDTPDSPIHYLITSTPTSTEWVIEMEDDPDIEIRRVSTYANRANLSADFIRGLEKDYEGTRMGRQEMYGEVLRDVVGALWNDSMFRHHKIEDPSAFTSFCDTMDDIVVAVDPAGTANKRSDETGIMAVGVQHSDDAGVTLDADRFYVLGDATLRGTPTEWARAVFSLARTVHAHRIIAENNFGGEMVEQVLRYFAKLHPTEALDHNGEAFRIKVVRAEKSKETRAEGTVGKYEQGRVTHVPNPTVYGDMAPLEKEQSLWVPRSRGGKSPSPNRIDALVWAVRSLESGVKFGTQMGSTQALPLSAQGWPEVGGSRETPTPVMPAARQKIWEGAPKTPVPKAPKPRPVAVPVPAKKFNVAAIRKA